MRQYYGYNPQLVQPPISPTPNSGGKDTLKRVRKKKEIVDVLNINTNDMLKRIGSIRKMYDFNNKLIKVQTFEKVHYGKKCYQGAP